MYVRYFAYEQQSCINVSDIHEVCPYKRDFLKWLNQ